MKPTKDKFHMEKYYNELQHLQSKLTKLKIQKPTKNIRKDSSDKKISIYDTNPQITKTIEKSYYLKESANIGFRKSIEESDKMRNSKHYQKEFLQNEVNSSSPQLTKIKSIPAINGKQEMYFKNRNLQKNTNDAKYQQKKIVSEEEIELQSEQIPADFTPQEQRYFIKSTNQIYQVNSPPVNQLIQQIQKRDEIYKIVAQKFSGSNPKNYKLQLQALFKRQELLLKIIEQFKRLSNVEVQEYEQLYQILKNE